MVRFSTSAIKAVVLLGFAVVAKGADDTVRTKEGRRTEETFVPVTFYAMGDAPYSSTERENLPYQIDLLRNDVDFAIHLGDMQDRMKQCPRRNYLDVGRVLQTSKIPMFIVPGK
jgi:hypothetical protein